MTTKIIVAVIVVLLILSVAMYGAWWLKKDTVELTSAVISGAGTDAAPYVVTAMLPTAVTPDRAMTLWPGKSLRVSASSLKTTFPISGTIKSAAVGGAANTVVLTMSSLGVPAGSAYAAAAGDTARVLLKY